jgi:hypothetical protein
MSMKSSLLVWALLGASSALGATSCYRASQSKMSQGRSYRSGQADFDRFFEATHALQVRIAAAQAEFADARQNLTSAVVVAKDASSAALVERIKSELDRVARHGAYVRVEFITPPSLEPSATRAVLAPTSKPRAVDATLIRQLENSVTRLLRLDASMKLSRQELHALATTALELEGSLDRAFPRSNTQRDEVVLNLHDAERAITLMLASAEGTQKPTADFLGKLSVALGSPWRPPSAPEVAGEQRLARSSRSTEPARTSSETAPPPAPAAAKPGSSLEPVTRAEFEP